MLGGCLAEALGDKAGVRRFASMLLPLDEALIEVALDLSGRPYLAYGARLRARHARARLAAVRPAAGRGVLAGLRHGGQPDAAHPAARGEEHPPHAGGQLQGGGPVPARRRARRGRWHPLHQGEPVTAAPRIAVLDYGIGNLRSAEKALQHVGAATPRWSTDPADVAAADAVVLPGVGAFGACARALRESGLDGPARDGRRGRACPSSASASASSCSTRGRSRVPGAAGLGVFAGDGRGRCRRGEAPADAVEPAGGAAAADGARAAARAGPAPVGLLRALVRAAGRRRDGRRVRLRRAGGGLGQPRHAVGRPVPPGEVGRRPAWRCWRTSWTWPAAA